MESMIRNRNIAGFPLLYAVVGIVVVIDDEKNLTRALEIVGSKTQWSGV
jgi:hypothetical protein